MQQMDKITSQDLSHNLLILLLVHRACRVPVRGYKGLLTLIDDALLYAATPEELLQHLDKFLHALLQHGIRLSPKKACFLCHTFVLVWQTD